MKYQGLHYTFMMLGLARKSVAKLLRKKNLITLLLSMIPFAAQ
jgi:hypothetical protein